MKIDITKEEALKMVFDAFANGGLRYDIHVSVTEKQKEAVLNGVGCDCFEDMLCKILEMGEFIMIYDVDESFDPLPLNLELIMKRIHKYMPPEMIVKAVKDEGEMDSWDWYCVLQIIYLKEVVFG